MPKLLIVDDEKDIQEFAKNYFQKREIRVFTAGNGKSALEIVEAENPDLVLLDITMDGMNGIEVLRHLRKAGNEMPVVMVTGIDDEETVNQAKDLRISGYIHKPLVLDELEKIVLAEFDKLKVKK